MSVRITRIQVKPGGPLERPVDWTCGDLTLAYGPNETGKSYVVEFLIKCLFHNTSGWTLRDLPAGGGVTVSGLTGDANKMSRTKRPKLDEAPDEDSPGPLGDLCQLLVVSQGHSRLTVAETGDGIERNMLRDLFSGERLIESIQKSSALPKLAAEATFEAGTISGHGNWRDFKHRERVLAEIEATDELVERFNTEISHGAIAALTARQTELQTNLAALEDARQHRANQLDDHRKTLDEQLGQIPSTEEITQVSVEIQKLRQTRIAIKDKRERQQQLARQKADLDWAGTAADNYDRIVSARPVADAPPPWLAIAAAAVLLIAVTAGLFGQRWGLGLLTLVSAALAGTHYWQNRRRQTPEPDDPVELDRIGDEFLRRFGEPLGDRSSLSLKIESLKKAGNEAEVLSGQLETETPGAAAETNRIGRLLTGWAKRDLVEDDWDEEIESLKRQRHQFDRQFRDTQSELDRLGITPEATVGDDPGTPWNAERFDRVVEQLREADEDLRKEADDQSELLDDVRRSTPEANASDWESLLAALEQRLDQLHSEYHDVTARMIAQFAVHQVLDGFAAEEAEMIDEGLERAMIRDSIQLMTPRYRALRVGENGLMVIDSDDNEFRVADLSTGAREQVFLGARLGFARIALDNEPSFLVLDDAFQHSDWNRRKQLVQQAVGLVEAGWQVLYFTMDDHIRDLFNAEGERLGERYVTHSLSEPSPSEDR